MRHAGDGDRPILIARLKELRLVLKYLGSSLIRRIVRTPQPIRDTANNGCERVGGGSSPRLLSVAGLELLALAPGWLRLLVVGAAGGVAIGWILVVLKNTVQEYLYKQDHETMRKSLVNVQLEESQGQYQSLRTLFENLLAKTSSDISNDAEDIAAKSQANKKIIGLINETLQINPEKEFKLRIEKKIKLLAAIRDYLDCYWDSVPKEAHTVLIQLAVMLNISVRSVTYAENLDRKLYRFYQGITSNYIRKLADKLKQSGISDYLWEIEDKGGNVIDRFPTTAEEEAIERIKDIGNKAQWEKLPKSEKKLTDEEIEKYMKENGLS